MIPAARPNRSSGGIRMTSQPAAPPLPPPLRPDIAAQAVSQAAQAAASAWAQRMSPAAHRRAVSQLYSTLRDLGIAAKGLARYQTAGHPADPAPPRFSQHIAASAQWFLEACDSLDGVLAAEGLGPVADPTEPGAELCHTARSAIVAWRLPYGTSAERDTTVRQLVTATGFLAAAALSLTTYAPRRPAIDLNAVHASLTEAATCLMKVVPVPDAVDAAPELRHDHNPDGRP
jgi:hypothetical protein